MNKCSSLLALLSAIIFSIPAHANITGTHLQNFNPTTDGMCFVTVHCAQPLEPGYVNAGVFLNYATNSLPFFRNPSFPTTQKLSEPNDKLLSSDFSLGLGIMKGWDVGVAFPFVLDQDIDDFTQLGTYEETGLTEWKLNTKVRFVNTETWGMAAVANVSFDRVANNPFSGNDPGPTITGEIVYDYKINENFLWGANAGYRFRDDGSAIAGTGVTPIGDQFIYSTAVAYMYRSWETTFIGELYGSMPTDDQDLPTDRKPSNLEVIAGLKKTVAERWDIHAGIGTELYHGLATPDFRIYAGLNLRVGPLSSREEPVAPPPMPAEPVKVVNWYEEPPDEVMVIYSINFDTNLTTMTAASKNKFKDTVAQLQKKVPDLSRIVVEGHTDHVGTDAYNMKLSQGRAETVANLIQRGLTLNDDQIKAIGRGEGNPVATNDNAAGRSKNRRVELKIYRKK